MADYVQPEDVIVGGPGEAANQNAQNDSLANLNIRVASSEALIIQNFSFESDLDLDGDPDSWDKVELAGGGTGNQTGAVNMHGAFSAECSRVIGSGNGGCQYTSAFIPVAPGDWELSLWYEASAALKSTATVLVYDSAKSLIATLVASTIQEATRFRSILTTGSFTALARFAKVKLIGGTVDVDVAGNAYFDGVQLKQTAYNHPVLLGGSYAVGFGSYTTVESFVLAVPADCDSIDILLPGKPTLLGDLIQVRLNSGATNGTPVQYTDWTGFVEKTVSLTGLISAGIAGTLATINIQARQAVGSGIIKTTSDVTEGFEAKIALNP